MILWFFWAFNCGSRTCVCTTRTFYGLIKSIDHCLVHTLVNEHLVFLIVIRHLYLRRRWNLIWMPFEERWMQRCALRTSIHRWVNTFQLNGNSLQICIIVSMRIAQNFIHVKKIWESKLNISLKVVERHNKPEVEVRGNKELLLRPVIISRNEKERVLIEGSINSIRWALIHIH